MRRLILYLNCGGRQISQNTRKDQNNHKTYTNMSESFFHCSTNKHSATAQNSPWPHFEALELCLTETSFEIQSCRDLMLLNMDHVMRKSAFGASDQVTRKPARLSLEIPDLDSIAIILSRQRRTTKALIRLRGFILALCEISTLLISGVRPKSGLLKIQNSILRPHLELISHEL